MHTSEIQIPTEQTTDLGTESFSNTIDVWKTDFPEFGTVQSLTLAASTRPTIEVRVGRQVDVGRIAIETNATQSDVLMSRAHFSIECTSQGGVIRDLGSTNGTFLNGLCITASVLREGNKVIAGGTIFTVHFIRTSTSERHLGTGTAVEDINDGSI